jgi:hypothetical protein
MNLLRSKSCTRAVLGTVMYCDVHSDSCAPIACNLSSLATVPERFLHGQLFRSN